MAEIRIDTAGVDDVRAIQARRRVDDLTMRLSLGMAEAGRAWVARDDSEIVGIAVAYESDDERYVGDWYVEPSFRGNGIGKTLLDAALLEAGNRALSVVIDPADVSAAAIALRRGLSRSVTIAQIEGTIPKEEVLAQMAAGDYRFEFAPVEPISHSMSIDALDREARGTTRLDDHVRWSASATGQLFFVNGELVGYSYVWPDGRIGPCACVSTAYARQLFAFSLVTLQRRHGASWCTMLLPATNTRVGGPVLRAGLRIANTFVVASDTAATDLSRYVGYTRLMF